MKSINMQYLKKVLTATQSETFFFSAAASTGVPEPVSPGWGAHTWAGAAGQCPWAPCPHLHLPLRNRSYITSVRNTYIYVYLHGYASFNTYHWQYILIICILFSFVKECSLWPTELISMTLKDIQPAVWKKTKQNSLCSRAFRELESGGKHCGLGWSRRASHRKRPLTGIHEGGQELD